MKRSALMILVVSLVAAGPLEGQGLRALIENLFIFSESADDPLFLQGSADEDDPLVRAHGEHFIPAAVGNNATLIQFLTTAVGTNIANIPISSTSGGVTYRFEAGVPIPTSTSPGPIIGERAQTLGRGRVLVGANVTRLKFKSIRGIQMDNIILNFTHENVDFAGCDAQFNGDCSLMGIPNLENDFIQLDLDLDLDVTATTFVLSYGLLDRVDIGAVVPIISTSLRGTSRAQVFPFGGPTAVHFFEGTQDDPTLTASQSVAGSASGVGDIAARLKIGISESSTARFAILGEARFPTGSEEDLLGSGELIVRGLGIVSAQFGDFSAHGNIGYAYHESAQINDAVLATVGFDQVMSPWATFALDLQAELQVGDNKLGIPEDVQFDTPFARRISPTTIPDMRDDIINAAAGFKFTTPSGLTIVTNTIWPLNRGGLRPDVVWTAGLEFSF
jgi:hypothetical protein